LKLKDGLLYKEKLYLLYKKRLKFYLQEESDVGVALCGEAVVALEKEANAVLWEEAEVFSIRRG
jgi:hypothetical protein